MVPHKNKLETIKDEWQSASTEIETETLFSHRKSSELQVSFTEEEFVAAVEKVQEYIAAGDVFQVNLTVRQSRNFRFHLLRCTRNCAG